MYAAGWKEQAWATWLPPSAATQASLSGGRRARRPGPCQRDANTPCVQPEGQRAAPATGHLPRAAGPSAWTMNGCARPCYARSGSPAVSGADLPLLTAQDLTDSLECTPFQVGAGRDLLPQGCRWYSCPSVHQRCAHHMNVVGASAERSRPDTSTLPCHHRQTRCCVRWIA